MYVELKTLTNQGRFYDNFFNVVIVLLSWIIFLHIDICTMSTDSSAACSNRLKKREYVPNLFLLNIYYSFSITILFSSVALALSVIFYDKAWCREKKKYRIAAI